MYRKTNYRPSVHVATKIGSLGSAVMLFILGGCANLAPDLTDTTLKAFKGPAMHAPVQGERVQENAAWWEALNNKDINLLQAKLKAQNYSLKAALTRLAAAQGIKPASLLPVMPKGSLGVSSNQNLSRGTSQNSFSKDPSEFSYNQKSRQKTLSISWDVPLFGQIPALLAQSQADTDTAYWNLKAAELTLSTELINSYLDWAYQRKQLKLLEQEVAETKELLSNNSFLVKKGVGVALDTSKYQIQLLDLQSQIQQANAQIQYDANKIAAMLAEVDTSKVSDMLKFEGDIFEELMGLPVVTTINAQSIRSKPEVALAEAKVLASAAQAGLAKANLYPQLTLQGTITEVYGDLDTQGFSKGVSKNGVGSIGLHIPLLDWFSLKAQADYKKAEMEAVVFDYRNAVVAAWQDANTAFRGYSANLELVKTAQSSEASFDTAKVYADLFKKGLVSKDDLKTAQLKELALKKAIVDRQNEYCKSVVLVMRGMKQLT